eukprot:1812160-Amphidinium_carterae.1
MAPIFVAVKLRLCNRHHKPHQSSTSDVDCKDGQADGFTEQELSNLFVAAVRLYFFGKLFNLRKETQPIVVALVGRMAKHPERFTEQQLSDLMTAAAHMCELPKALQLDETEIKWWGFKPIMDTVLDRMGSSPGRFADHELAI